MTTCEDETPICEVCDSPLKEDRDEDQNLCGCNHCGRVFCPACNSEDPNLCIDCYEQGENRW